MSDNFVTLMNDRGQPKVAADTVAASVYPGWKDLISNLIDDLFNMGWDGHLQQIKEKFGTLRFYAFDIDDQMANRISKAETDSGQVCRECGQPGKMRGTGWMKVLCDKHEAIR